MELTNELKQKIIKALKPLNPVKIIIFGSYAYGEPNEDSDLDIFVIKKDYKNKWEEKAKIRKALSDIRIPKDILVETEEFFNSHTSDEWINTAWHNANRYGEVLYEKR